MNVTLRRGRYLARYAGDAADLRAAQRLRHLCFVERGGAVPRAGGIEADAFDARCQHVLVEDSRTGRLVACCRLLPVTGAGIAASYSAQHYDLTNLAEFVGPMVEMGRFCIDPEVLDADVLRVAWGAVARYVDAAGVGLLFGCSSFAGTVAAPYHDAFALLGSRCLAPGRWRPGVRAPGVFAYVEALGPGMPDLRAAMTQMPPLLRSYLAMGGWVSDHAVVDHDMNTLHVFTGLEIATIPPARARALRAVAEEGHAGIRAGASGGDI